MNQNFLLRNEHSRRIYMDICRELPIVDYHSHLKADDIYNNRFYRDITEIWLEADHYKWRLMRANGIPEFYITGDASPKEKFEAWLKTLERAIGNPVYQWAHMEASFYFGIDQPLRFRDADSLWETMNAKLGPDGLRARDFLASAKVELVATTDQIICDLSTHQLIQDDPAISVKVVPTLRLDPVVSLQNRLFIDQIEVQSGVTIKDLDTYLIYIQRRMEFFRQMGCVALDLGIEYIPTKSNLTNPNRSFNKILTGQSISTEEQNDLTYYLIVETMKRAHAYDWVYQVHIGATPSVNQLLRDRLGMGKGYDALLDQTHVASDLIVLLNSLSSINALPKMVFYAVDATLNHAIQNVIASFQNNEKGIRGKLQFGPAWWFQDTQSGNTKQLIDTAEQGILANFIGMTTDSRSFMSFVRHDYFRRILCSIIGTWMEEGAVVDEAMLIEILNDICYNNAKAYFNF